MPLHRPTRLEMNDCAPRANSQTKKSNDLALLQLSGPVDPAAQYGRASALGVRKRYRPGRIPTSFERTLQANKRLGSGTIRGCHPASERPANLETAIFNRKLPMTARRLFDAAGNGCQGIHLLTASFLLVAGASGFSTSCDTGISRIPSSWPLASARLNARHACQKQR